MNVNTLQVNMLGGFSIEWNGQKIDDSDNRMHKVWLLIAYLIYLRNTQISQNDILSLLWDDVDDCANPQGAMKTMLYRARTLLNRLDESAGHDFIIRQGGSYRWNTEIPLQFDVEQFDLLCQKGSVTQEEDLRLECYQKALELYAGDFLPKLSMESWVVPISAYYHKLYLKVAEETLAILEARQAWGAAKTLSAKALKIEPYNESLYCSLMRSQLASGENAAVASTYETMSELLFSNFGVMPSDEARAIYREATRSNQNLALPITDVRDLLRENDPAAGALFCEYDFFKTLYRVQARALARSGETIHIGLISVQSHGNKPLSRRSLDHAMENLKEQIVMNLRQGDVVTQCSVSQFILMLPHANYENSCMVCGRIVRSFFRQYPHSPVDIRYSVQPLDPRI